MVGRKQGRKQGRKEGGMEGRKQGGREGRNKGITTTSMRPSVVGRKQGRKEGRKDMKVGSGRIEILRVLSLPSSFLPSSRPSCLPSFFSFLPLLFLPSFFPFFLPSELRDGSKADRFIDNNEFLVNKVGSKEGRREGVMW